MERIKIPKKITPAKFAKWLKEHTLCSVKVKGGRVEAVIDAGHIEPSLCFPLIAEWIDETLEVSEFSQDYYSMEAAFAAINNGEETYSPIPFHDWVQNQYLTAKSLKITRVNIS